MATTQQVEQAKAKAQATNSVYACKAAIADCHHTLTVGGYDYHDPYAQKLGAEIDAYRDRILQLQR